MNNEINGTLNLLEICKQNNIKKFIYMSSISIHGSVDYEVDESSPLNPKHFYGASKIAGENIINIFAKISKIKTYIFRPNLIEGCDLNYPDLITIFIKEGEINFYKEFDFNGNFKFSDSELLKALNLKVGQIYNEEKFYTAIYNFM